MEAVAARDKRVEKGLSAFMLPTAGLADIGSDVVAGGAPTAKELSQPVTKGISSGRRRVEGRTFLQADVSINGGNGGGARQLVSSASHCQAREPGHRGHGLRQPGRAGQQSATVEIY